MPRTTKHLLVYITIAQWSTRRYPLLNAAVCIVDAHWQRMQHGVLLRKRIFVPNQRPDADSKFRDRHVSDAGAPYYLSAMQSDVLPCALLVFRAAALAELIVGSDELANMPPARRLLAAAATDAVPSRISPRPRSIILYSILRGYLQPTTTGYA